MEPLKKAADSLLKSHRIAFLARQFQDQLRQVRRLQIQNDPQAGNITNQLKAHGLLDYWQRIRDSVMISVKKRNESIKQITDLLEESKEFKEVEDVEKILIKIKKM